MRRAKGGKQGESDPGRASLEDEEVTAMDTAMAAKMEIGSVIGSKTQELQSGRHSVLGFCVLSIQLPGTEMDE